MSHEFTQDVDMPYLPSSSKEDAQVSFPVLEDPTSMSIEVTAARSRDEHNLQIMKGFAQRRLQLSDKSASTSVLAGKEAVVPGQSIPTPGGAGLSTHFKYFLSLSENSIKSHLMDMTNRLLVKPNICSPCFIHGLEHSHQMHDCTEVAFGYQESGSKFNQWKSRHDIPKFHCYSCGIPQVSALSPGISKISGSSLDSRFA
jgi:hypothetical protein